MHEILITTTTTTATIELTTIQKQLQIKRKKKRKTIYYVSIFFFFLLPSFHLAAKRKKGDLIINRFLLLYLVGISVRTHLTEKEEEEKKNAIDLRRCKRKTGETESRKFIFMPQWTICGSTSFSSLTF